ncbi:Protein ERGIC-53-like [Lachnellula subtilissima]|uniref:Protein ERGIC-53-like n=1 Tax=Lachnellula subtilissima TaxID=602034 RepID=A0A8H8U6A1_9HELO|nr:Protein ERGIC-53-like [Lachnellula subtilissima]
MYFSKTPLTLASAFLVASAKATYLNPELSFGQEEKISPNLRAVPNFHIIGNPKPPEILSNKLVLTPPVPGNQRGAIWAEKPLMHSSWSVDVDFRATGPERGGGNFMVYLAKNGREDIGTASIYTVGRFDGLALVVDQYAGSGGSIRGFLNDGSTEYKSHHSVDSLAFGHCEYSYRNLGRPSRIAIRQSPDSFSVDVDGRRCFDSPKIKIPLGYYFGVSAASAENPDSFEVFRFVTTTDSHTPDVAGQPGEQLVAAPDNQAQAQQPIGNTQNTQRDLPEEAPASQYTSSDAQFADLHNRLQAMMRAFSMQTQAFQTYQQQSNARHETLLQRITAIEASAKQQEGTGKVLKDIQSDVRQTKADLHNALDQHVAGLKSAVREGHSNVLDTLANTGTGLWKFVFVVFGSQALLVGGFVLYKRRKANGPKKYL